MVFGIAPLLLTDDGDVVLRVSAATSENRVYAIHIVQCYFDSKYPDSPIYATYILYII